MIFRNVCEKIGCKRCKRGLVFGSDVIANTIVARIVKAQQCLPEKDLFKSTILNELNR